MLSNAIAKTKSVPRQAVIVLVLVVALLASTSGFIMRYRPATASLQLGNRTYTLEIVDTPAAQAKGLGSRASLAPNHGMLFSFNHPSTKCFWMKDMHFPLDIIWLDDQQRVQSIEAQVSPQTYPRTFCSPKSTQYVIELNAGQAQAEDLRPGQQLSL